MSFFSAPKIPSPALAPVTPRLSDVQLRAKDEAASLRGRHGIEDQILSLGKVGRGAPGTGGRKTVYTSLIGRTAAE